MESLISVGTLLRDATRRLEAAGVGSPRVDAELLLAELLDVPRSRALTHDTVGDATAERYHGWVARRANREPLQHIAGRAPFRNLMLEVGPGVFVPRPETELLVDAVLPRLRELEAPIVVDLCAGSGALGLAVADEAPNAQVFAVESSFGALRWLGRNAAGTRAQVVPGDVRDPELLRGLCGRVDAVVCNPPYVPAGADISVEARADPAEALFAGTDGLDLMPTLIGRAADLLVAGGLLALEHDDTHGAAVPALIAADERFGEVADHLDLTGRPRYATARRLAGHSKLRQDVGRGAVL